MDISQAIESAVVNAIRDKSRGFCPALMRTALLPLSWAFGAASSLRSWSYTKGILPSRRLPIPVISIGNIVAGGSGKTPLSLLIAERLSQTKRVALLSRGYRSQAEKEEKPTVVSWGNGPLCLPEICGDEPYMIARRLPQLLVIVGQDRLQAAQMAIEAGADLILLDDGMQHRRLGRDREIVAVDVNDPFGGNYYLPRGFLRESPCALSRATLVALNNIDPANLTQADAAASLIRKYTSAPLLYTMPEFQGWYDLHGQPAQLPRNTPATVVCGIANPATFLQMLRRAGVDIVKVISLPDHTFSLPDNLSGLVLVTEKDAVKAAASQDSAYLTRKILWPKLQLKILQGENFLSSQLQL